MRGREPVVDGKTMRCWLGLWIEPEFYCGGDLGGDGSASLGGGLVFILLHGFDRGCAEGRRAGDDRDFADVAVGAHFGRDSHIAGDEIPHGIGWINGLGRVS